MVGDLKEKVVILLIAVTLLCTPSLGQTTAIDWDNKGAVLEAQGKYSEAIGAYNKAIDIIVLSKTICNLYLAKILLSTSFHN